MPRHAAAFAFSLHERLVSKSNSIIDPKRLVLGKLFGLTVTQQPEVMNHAEGGALDFNGSGRVPASLYVAKYNRYVDSIIDRIRKVLRKSFDPVNVRLHSTTRVKNNTNKNKVKTGPKTPKQSTTTLERQLQEESLLKAQMMSSEANVEEQQPRRRGGGGGQPGGHGGQQQRPNRPQNQNNNTKNKVGIIDEGEFSFQGRNKPRAKATLMGLSSIRRDGDVSVNLMSSHTSVRSNFLLGPLILKVEKEVTDFGRGETKELRSASAVTEEMSGTMALRISPEGIASLHSMKVLQPKQVRVESADDHDRTREFVWRRSSHIARLVSRKLAAAARSMLGSHKTDRMLAEEGKSLVQAQANLYASEMSQSHS
ncbi:hypothetical protein J437_LFUL004567 [Ladona fulva]|uniref:Uncharacterized protein n=1 Tax=Ladona fulva TaxID=123851 RepID=A0A8K0NUM1_LADFU|nr:hypothetical protein J437_LFUL004567 [Ladona fulva]